MVLPSILLNEFRPRTEFNQYYLLEQIGAGGQGIVWSALDREQQRVVAVKFSEVPGAQLEDVYDELHDRQTTRLVELSHPNVLPLYEIGAEGRLRFFVSPYIAGGSLLDRIAEGPVRPAEGLRYAAEIAAALRYLHTQGVIHRDLKSSNVLIDLSHNAYLADFGIARLTSATTQAVHTGRGTPLYAPPEQHKLTGVSPQSDIYSFGIMLFELFTGQLPWKGEVTLGIRQLYEEEQLPDPRSLNPHLPEMLTSVLRRMTASDPQHRPATADETMELLFSAFEAAPFRVSDAVPVHAEFIDQDARQLLQTSLQPPDETEASVRLSLTKFAMVDAYLRREALNGTIPEQVKLIMLRHALTFGYNDDFWWPKVASPAKRLAAAALILSRGSDPINLRIVDFINADPQLAALPDGLPEAIIPALLGVARESHDPDLGWRALEILRRLTPPAGEWRNAAFDPQQDQALAELALSDSPSGEEAARLIGHLRSETAAQQVAQSPDRDNRTTALVTIQQAAGSLPHSIPARTRRSVGLEWMLYELFDQPLTILAAYGLTFLGTLLGFGLQFYLTYRLPEFLDMDRTLVSLERGGVLGIAFGLGILITRLIVERFARQPLLARLVPAVLLGMLFMNLAISSYNILFQSSPSSGLVVTLACLLIALGFALAGLTSSRPRKIGICILAIVLAIAGSWWIHLRLMPAVSPLFHYETFWSAARVLATAFAVATPIAILGNLLNLAPRES
ncbi:MAG: serine/threonine protein kinase [Anaerolineales bacterium]|nr:serine/threonine protein kinase [Anaerolineales bacterium]